MSRSCPWSKKAACYCSLIRESKTAAAPKGERDAAYADLPLNHSCLRGPTSFMIICRRLFDLTPSASLCEGTPKPRSTIIWREGPALYSTHCLRCDGVDGETPWKCAIDIRDGVEMAWKCAVEGRLVDLSWIFEGDRGNAVENRRAGARGPHTRRRIRTSWKCRGNKRGQVEMSWKFMNVEMSWKLISNRRGNRNFHEFYLLC